MIQKIFGRQFQGVASAAFLIGGFSVLAKLLGLYRNRIFTGQFGAGSTLDVYYAGFLIPDFIYNLFVLGLLSVVFIPVFSEYFHKDEKEAWRLANISLNFIAIFIAVFAVLAYFLMPYILPLVVHGFSEEMKSEAVSVSRLMLLSPIFLSLSAVLGSIVQNFRKYIFYSLSPIFYNVGIILGALLFGESLGARGIAIGVIVGAIFYFLIQVAGAISSGFKYSPILDFGHLGFWKMGKLSVARFFTLASWQINFIVLTGIASSLTVGSIAVLNLANDLQFIPIGIIALSYSVVIFPKLSEAVAKNDQESFSAGLFAGLRQVLFLVLPVSIIFIFTSFEIVVALYGVDASGLVSSKLVAGTLVFFSISIFAQSLSYILTRAFYAMQNTAAHLVASVASVATTIALSFVFVDLFDAGGKFFHVVTGVLNLEGDLSQKAAILSLPIAFSCGSLLNFGLLFIMLKKSAPYIDFSRIQNEVIKIIIASVAMATAIYSALQLDFLKDGIYFSSLTGVAASVLVGGMVYVLVLWAMKSEELSRFLSVVLLLITKIGRQKAKTEIPANIERVDGADRT